MLNFTNRVVGRYQVEAEVTEEMIEDVMVTCFEGGSDYWMGIVRNDEVWQGKPKDEPISTWATHCLLNGQVVPLYDIEDDGDCHDLTLDKLINGIRLNAKHRPHDSNIEDGDAITADCILQYALFEEVIYG